MRQEILVGAERRRRWSVEQKLRILAEVGVDDATVSDVARRYTKGRSH
ncbi:transposase [Nguyenibacter vanlangensis]|uniref:Transposase n=1 Tax=Nguyenibacter vanlangensis TaxID=1216886 RepID=A0A7Y7M5X6_9PROT|nr:transposase [Nguyenibacter vanlangensis]